MSIAARLSDLFRPRQSRAAFALTDTTLANPQPWLLEGLGATPTLTGEILTKKGAEAIPAVWACKHRLESDVGKLPLDAYERTENGGRRKAVGSWQHFLTRIRPNPEQSPMAFKRMLMFHRLSYGDAYAEIEREEPGNIRSPGVALWPLLSDRTRAQRFEGQKILVTRVRQKRDDGSMSPAEPKVLMPGEYIHIPGRGFDGLRSYSPIEVAPNTLGLAKAQIEWLASFYDGDALSAAWVKVPGMGPPTPANKARRDIIRDSIREQGGGLRRAHRLGILWDGAELQDSVVTPREQQLVEGMNLSGLDICRLFDMKPHKVAYLENATFSNISEENLAYVGDCIMPHTQQIREALDWDLFGRELVSKFFFDWNFKALLQATPREEAETLKIGVNTGWISRAEARQVTNMNPADEDQGLGEHLVMVNQIPSRTMAGLIEGSGGEEGARAAYRTALGLPAVQVLHRPEVGRFVADAEARAAAAPKSAAQRNRLRVAWLPVFHRAAERYVSVEVAAARRALDRAGDDLKALNKTLAQFWEDFPEAIRRELAPVVTGFGAVIADAISDELGAPVSGPVFDVAVEAAIAGAIVRHINKSRAGVLGVIQDHPTLADAKEALGARFQKWLDIRPGKIADSESVRAGGQLAQDAYQGAGLREKTWVAFDGCELCQSLNGQVVGISGSFIEKGGKVDPGTEGTEPMIVDRNILTPPLHGGCECTIAGG